MAKRPLIRICIAIVVLSAATPAMARPWKAPPGGHTAEEYRRNAGHWEMAYLALSAVDLAQTASCLHRERCSEANPLIGRHPSMGKLVAIRAAGGLAQYGVFRYLNDRDPIKARSWAIGATVVQGLGVGLNARLMF